MRRLTAGLVAALSILAAFPVADSISPIVLTSTQIVGDAEFDAAHGVRAGNGTVDDPYVISNVTLLLAPETYGFRLVGTRAHVRFEDVRVEGAEGPVWGCGVEGCPFPRAFELVDAQNVTIRRLDVRAIAAGLHATAGSDHLTVEDVLVGGGAPFVLTGAPAVTVHNATDVVLRRVWSIVENEPMHFEDIRDLVVEGGAWDSPAYPARLSRIVGARISGVTFNGDVQVFDSVDVAFVGNSFHTFGNLALVATGSRLYATQSALVCGNTWSSTDVTALYVYGVSDALVTGNTISAPTAFKIGSSASVDLVRNSFVDIGGATIERSEDVRLKSNAFPASTAQLRLIGTVTGDITENWWGDASGPAPIGTGMRVTGSLPVAPWLTSPPDTTVDCAELAPPPPTRTPLYRTQIEYPAETALVVRARSPAGEVVNVVVSTEGFYAGQGDEISVGIHFDPDDAHVYSQVAFATRWDEGVFVDVRGVGGNTIYQATADGRTGGASSFINCSGVTACADGVALVAASTLPGTMSVVILSAIPDPDVDIDASGRAGLVTTRTMEGEFVHASAGGLSATRAQGMRLGVDIEHALWGYTAGRYATGAYEYAFERTGPDGHRVLGPSARLEDGGPAGHYEWTFEGASVGGDVRPLALWADIDLG